VVWVGTFDTRLDTQEEEIFQDRKMNLGTFLKSCWAILFSRHPNIYETGTAFYFVCDSCKTTKRIEQWSNHHVIKNIPRDYPDCPQCGTRMRLDNVSELRRLTQ
jgi:hypothetical protein